MRHKQAFLFMLALLIGAPIMVVQSQGQRPNFSGFWELDTAQSQISLPTQASTSGAQVIEHREPKLQIIRIIFGNRTKQTLQLELTTDNRETRNTVEGYQLSFKARWKGSRLVIDVAPAGQGQRAGFEEVWFLSRDGRTLTIELYLRGSNRSQPQKLVYVAKSGFP
jgi:hypothetical protein